MTIPVNVHCTMQVLLDAGRGLINDETDREL